MVHYLNAGMLEDSAKRDEEALVTRGVTSSHAPTLKLDHPGGQATELTALVRGSSSARQTP